MASYPPAVARLIDALERLPSIGPRTAQRLALWLLAAPEQRMAGLAESIAHAAATVKLCLRCGFFSEAELCPLCADPRRDDELICVVGDARDLLAIEESGSYRGRYHVLGGVLSPMDGIGPQELNLAGLLERAAPPVREIILALNPTPEGDTTANYLARLLQPKGVRVTRPALGLPVGGDLDYADRVTIERALEGRREV